MSMSMSLNTPLRALAATTASTTSNIQRTSTTTTFICSQCRHATLLRRPKRPYTFTQLIALSDGSTFTHRTTSPMPVYRSTRDTRNSLLWNPSSNKLMNVEEDEAGRLAAFRAKFGRGWDARSTSAADGTTERKDDQSTNKKAKSAVDGSSEAEPKMKGRDGDGTGAGAAGGKGATQVQESEEDDEEDNLLDLISSFGQEEDAAGKKQK